MSRWVLGVAIAALVGFGVGALTFAGAPSSGDESSDERWTCAMHPQVDGAGPGTCPLCGMDLVPASSMSDIGNAEVALSPRAAALARIRTVPVHRVGGGAGRRTLLGQVEVDETGLRTVTAWVAGRVDRLMVRATGERVRRGQTVATLYSPEVYAAHQDLLVAKRQLERLANASPVARSASQSSLEAARQRLRLLGFEGRDLETLERATGPSRAVSIRAAFGGTVLERVATQGTYVSVGAPLYRLADLSRVWVQLDAYERDLVRLRVGQSVTMRFEAIPGEPFEGEVAFVDPVVDPRRRVAKVRVSVDNTDGLLRPGMIAEATLEERSEVEENDLVIPATAPLFTGRRSIVYVAMPGEPGHYEARTVSLGWRRGEGDDAIYAVQGGLREGEDVVVHGAFVLDAELAIRGGHNMMARLDDTERVELDDNARAVLGPVLAAYLDLSTRLAADESEGAKEAASRLLSALGAAELPAGDAAALWEPLRARLRRDTEALREQDDLGAMRIPFEPLSAGVAELLATLGNPTDAPIRRAHCPMAFGNRGAYWFQRGEELDNAYFGAAMRTCGSIDVSVEPNQHLDAQ